MKIMGDVIQFDCLTQMICYICFDLLRVICYCVTCNNEARDTSKPNLDLLNLIYLSENSGWQVWFIFI